MSRELVKTKQVARVMYVALLSVQWPFYSSNGCVICPYCGAKFKDICPENVKHKANCVLDDAIKQYEEHERLEWASRHKPSKRRHKSTI